MLEKFPAALNEFADNIGRGALEARARKLVERAREHLLMLNRHDEHLSGAELHAKEAEYERRAD